MGEVVRLTLVSHAMTDAMSAGRFPTDEPLNSVGSPPGRRLHRVGHHGQRILRTREAHQTDRGTPWPAGEHRPPAGRPGLRSMARRCARRSAARGPRHLADRSGQGAARRRIRRRAGQPRARLDGHVDHPPQPAGRRHTSCGHSRSDPGGSRRAAEVVLAHRHCARQPDRHALPRSRVDSAHPR